MYNGRKLLIATKHKKEAMIAPPLAKALQIESIATDNFDTDKFGTFTGEVERKDDAVSTARNKCWEAMNQYNFDLGIASEGSFAPHPSLFFLNANEETLIFIDRTNDLEIVARAISTETNFDGKVIVNEEQLILFSEMVQFPTHSLILSDAERAKTYSVKGIQNWNHLKNTFHQILNKYGSVYIQTDMRAMNNPSRRKVIEAATHKLIKRIRSCCPECKTACFEVSHEKEGLPCHKYGLPTRSAISHAYKCKKCEFSNEERYPHKKTTEDPTYCDICNP